MAAERSKASRIAAAIAYVIKQAGANGVPSGHIYATVMGDVSLDEYNRILAVLVDLKWVEQRRSHLLVWVGPL